MHSNQTSINNKLTIKDKIFSLDYKLILTVLILGIISCFAMYSTDNGTFGYHTISHIYRFFTFFFLFIFLSFIRISFWCKYSYLFYFLFLVLLFAVEFFGLSSSGSKRWINLGVLNLQPSELMKIGVIIFLARYYNPLYFVLIRTWNTVKHRTSDQLKLVKIAYSSRISWSEHLMLIA